MTTAAEVAKRAGVSTATVSRVMSGAPGVGEETRLKVLKAIEELGYVPNISAQMLVKGGRTPAGLQPQGGLGIVVSSNAVRYSHAFFTPIMEGIELEVVRQGECMAFVRTFEELSQPHVMAALPDLVDGLVIIGCPPSFETLAKLLEAGIRTVLVEFWYEGMDSVIFDRDAGMSQVVGHLIEKGHRGIGYIGGPDRMNSFRKAMRGHNLTLHPEWCNDYDGWTMRVGYENGRELVKAFLHACNGPTAFVAGSDDIAFGFIRACRDFGLRLPEDLSIASFDDGPMAAYMDPRLTSVAVDKGELGRIAVRRLLDRIRYGDVSPTVTLCPVSLVVRESVSDIVLGG